MAESRLRIERNAAMVGIAGEAMKYGVTLHATIASIAGNSWAQRFREQIASQVERYRYFTSSEPAARLCA